MTGMDAYLAGGEDAIGTAGKKESAASWNGRGFAENMDMCAAERPNTAAIPGKLQMWLAFRESIRK